MKIDFWIALMTRLDWDSQFRTDSLFSTGLRQNDSGSQKFWTLGYFGSYPKNSGVAPKIQNCASWACYWTKGVQKSGSEAKAWNSNMKIAWFKNLNRTECVVSDSKTNWIGSNRTETDWIGPIGLNRIELNQIWIRFKSERTDWNLKSEIANAWKFFLRLKNLLEIWKELTKKLRLNFLKSAYKSNYKLAKLVRNWKLAK